MTTLLLLAALAVILAPEAAHAYIDPGTGSMLLQLLIAGLLGSLYGLKMYWRRLVLYFRPPATDKQEKDAPEE